MSSPNNHPAAVDKSGPSDVPMDEVLQEATMNLSKISLVIDSLKNEVEAERCVHIRKKMEENRMKLVEISKNNYKLAVERRNLGAIDGGKIDNILTKRQNDAIAMQNGDSVSSSQDGDRARVILLGPGIPVKSQIPPIKLPKVEKIPPYTTWVFLDRNQNMTEDQSIVGRRRIYYDPNGGEALICSDSEEELVHEEDKAKEFIESEDNIISSTIKQTGASDIVYDLLAQRLSRKPFEIKERYEALQCSKPRDADSDMNSFFDRDLDEAQDSFNKLFCRRCLIFDCKLHGCSQELISPADKESSLLKIMDDEIVPCGPHCYLQLEGNSRVSSAQINTEETVTFSSAASEVPVIIDKSDGSYLRKRLKTSPNSQDLSEKFKSETMPVHDVKPTNLSPSTYTKKRVRESVTGGNEETKNDSFVPSAYEVLSDFESWRTLEKSLYKKGLEIFGRNSCLIARNVMGDRKTCAEVYHILHNNKLYSQGSNNIDSQDDKDRTESNENMGTSSRTKSNLFYKRSKLRRLKFKSTKSAGSDSIRKQKVDITKLHSRQYDPCGCQSVCGDDCPCLANGACCEKYCGCPKTCKARFRGCSCAKSQCRSRSCPCFVGNRECDPDVCRHCWISCGDGTLGSPGKRGNGYECPNMKLLLRQQQRVLLGRSEVSGWGAFLKNDVAKDEYLGEYTGELISHHEADKRGKIYDRENSSFLFNLNDQYVLDAFRKGDKLKFANHSPTPNCYAKVMMVAGDHRVGIYAKENISAGDELFYDYRYEPDKAPVWAKKPGDCASDAASSSGRAKKVA